jgi:hypothetical protein
MFVLRSNLLLSTTAFYKTVHRLDIKIEYFILGVEKKT